MKDIFTVAKFTMHDMISRKSFRVSTIIILLLIVIGFNVPNIISSFGGDLNSKIVISDPSDIYQDQLSQLEAESGYEFIIEDTDLDTIKNKITNGDIDSAILINQTDNNIALDYIVKNAAINGTIPDQLVATLDTLYRNLQISQLGLTSTQLSQLTAPITAQIIQVDEQEISGNIFVMMLMSIVLFYAIYFCAYQVSSSITVEKTSKIIETLVTSTSPRNIVLGKTIGIGVVGLLQMILFITVAIISANLFLDHEFIAQVLDLSNITVWLGLITIVYFILGYFVFAFGYALTGSTVSKPEDIQSANTPVALLAAISFYLAYFTLTDPTSSLNVFAAIFPFSSPFCMPIRAMMGLASGWEIAISVAILIITILIIARITIKIYSDAILNYGTKLSLAELIKMYKQK